MSEQPTMILHNTHVASLDDVRETAEERAVRLATPREPDSLSTDVYTCGNCKKEVQSQHNTPRPASCTHCGQVQQFASVGSTADQFVD
jgi:hypothetical protein